MLCLERGASTGCEQRLAASPLRWFIDRTSSMYPTLWRGVSSINNDNVYNRVAQSRGIGSTWVRRAYSSSISHMLTSVPESQARLPQ